MTTEAHMTLINEHYLNLSGSYLFSEIARRVKEFAAADPRIGLLRLGIGDVVRPLVPAVVEALRKAVDEQGTNEGFRGYGPEQGYDFLRAAVVGDWYKDLGIAPEEVFIGDGSKCDVGNFQELFGEGCRPALTDPVYPVYADSNVMAGRGGPQRADGSFDGLILLPATFENGFSPEVPAERPDFIYICSPNNPTGTAMDRKTLTGWVEYARKNESIILFDAAYEAYIRTPDVPHSIYEIPGARETAVEFRSYSKTAGFTGLRCSVTIVPKALHGTTSTGERVSIRDLWLRRQTTKYNGCPYITQRAAEAVHSPEGRAQCAALVAEYLENAGIVRRAFEELGLEAVGGRDAPYVWVKLPDGVKSWDFFDLLLHKAGIVGTPGVGFGPHGEGCFRFSGFGSRENILAAVERVRKMEL